LDYYIICVGGTGAKCFQALVHLSAAGLTPSGSIHVILVDPDDSNGSLNDALETVDAYNACRRFMDKDAPRFSSEIELITSSEARVWSPFHGWRGQKQLSDFFNYYGLRDQDNGAAYLFDSLYSKGEREAPLKDGFLGRPSLGALVLAETVKSYPGGHWEKFINNVATHVCNGGDARIMLAGSIFGGAGAAGVPTIARLLSDDIRSRTGRTNGAVSGANPGNLRIGAVAVLPYFDFQPTKVGDIEITSADFGLRTKTVLGYYHQATHLNVYDSMYFLGYPVPTQLRTTQAGGPLQKNDPHFIELYAALACVDFFHPDSPRGNKLISRQEGELNWSCLPHVQGAMYLRKQMEYLARFAFAYCSTYLPALTYFNINSHRFSEEAPWFIEYFVRERIDLDAALKEDLNAIYTYAKAALKWMADIQRSAEQAASAEGTRANLFNRSAFSAVKAGGEHEVFVSDASRDDDEFMREEFANLTSTDGARDTKALNEVWRRLCAGSDVTRNMRGISRFVNALYRECTLIP
jgi:hypothetical protein